MSAHGIPVWSIPAYRTTPAPAISPLRSRELQRLVFELRNLLENSGDLAAALDVVEGIEKVLAMPSAAGLPPVRSGEAPVGVALEALFDEALQAAAPALSAAKVIVLRRRSGQAIVFVERAAVMQVLEELIEYVVAACSQSPGLRILRIRTRKGRCGIPELTIDYSGNSLPPVLEWQHVARHVQIVHDARDSRIRLRFLRGGGKG